jgi:tetratricopeptide (TPR) repeat protein
MLKPRQRSKADNNKLSSLPALISDAEWDDLDATAFQRLVHDYLRARFGNAVEIKQGPPKGPDGGRDFELVFQHSHRSYKGYVECKHHRRSIGIETLGKYVVVVIVNHAKELHVVSSSAISGPARAHLVQVMGGMNIDVALIDGPHLESELQKYDVLEKYFPGKMPRRVAASPAEALRVDVHVRANSDFDPERAEAATEFQSYKDQFYLHVLLKNVGAVALRVSTVKIESDALLVAAEPIYGAPPEEMFALQDCSIVYGCRLIAPRDFIDDGQVRVSYKVAGRTYTRRVPMPNLSFHSLSEPPLVGETLKRFLTDDVARICRDIHQHQPRLIDVRGVSGVGKTRLLDELGARFREAGVATLRFDAMHAGDNVFRRLLAGLATVPVFEGRLAHTTRELEKILVERGCASKYAEALGKFLVEETSGWKERYAVTEALRHFLRKPVIAVPTAIVIDNVQEFSPQGLDVLLELLEFLKRKSGRVCVVLATNTEAMPAIMRAPVDELQNRLDAWNDGIFRTPVPVQPLTPEDAKLLLYSILNGIPLEAPRPSRYSPDAVIDAFIAKAGVRALDLVMAVRFLEENGVIKRTGALRWYIPKFQKFRVALETVPSGSSALIRRRLDAIREHKPATWTGARDILQHLVAFSGRLPTGFTAGGDADALDLLLDRGFLRRDAQQGVAAYVAFHDNIFRFLEERRAWQPNRTQGQRIVQWIDSQPESVRATLATAHLFNSITAGVSDAEVITIGERALSAAENDSPAVLRRVGERLDEYLTRSDIERSDFRRYLPIRMRYASVLLLQAAVKEGLQILDDLHDHVRAGALLDESDRDEFYHAYVNANLHCARYDTALRILRRRERDLPSDPFAVFRTYDRHGVAATAIGDQKEAALWLNRALKIAKGNADWQGTAHYDIAYIHVHLTHDANKAKAAFRRSLAAYEAMPAKPPWRQIEAAQIRAFVALLGSDLDAALDEAEAGLWLSSRHNLAYYAVKLLNMVGVVRVMSGDLGTGVEAFEEGMSRAAMSLNARGYWRAIANLGAVAAIRGDYEAARDYLLTVEANLRETIVDPRAIAREVPVVANYLAVLSAVGETATVERILAHWSNVNLDAFAATLRRKKLKVPGIVCHPSGFALLPT